VTTAFKEIYWKRMREIMLAQGDPNTWIYPVPLGLRLILWMLLPFCFVSVGWVRTLKGDLRLRSKGQEYSEEREAGPTRMLSKPSWNYE
jgi:membrane glycosyltransferase